MNRTSKTLVALALICLAIPACKKKSDGLIQAITGEEFCAENPTDALCNVTCPSAPAEALRVVSSTFDDYSPDIAVGINATTNADWTARRAYWQNAKCGIPASGPISLVFNAAVTLGGDEEITLKAYDIVFRDYTVGKDDARGWQNTPGIDSSVLTVAAAVSLSDDGLTLSITPSSSLLENHIYWIEESALKGVKITDQTDATTTLYALLEGMCDPKAKDEIYVENPDSDNPVYFDVGQKNASAPTFYAVPASFDESAIALVKNGAETTRLRMNMFAEGKITVTRKDNGKSASFIVSRTELLADNFECYYWAQQGKLDKKQCALTTVGAVKGLDGKFFKEIKVGDGVTFSATLVDALKKSHSIQQTTPKTVVDWYGISP